MTLLWLCATGITDKALKVISAVGPGCHVRTHMSTCIHLSLLCRREAIDTPSVILLSNTAQSDIDILVYLCVCVSVELCLAASIYKKKI